MNSDFDFVEKGASHAQIDVTTCFIAKHESSIIGAISTVVYSAAAT
jgi:hypothetical protein